MTGALSSEADFETYRAAVSRLTAENKALLRELADEREKHQREMRAAKAALNEGISPELAVLYRQLQHWKNRALSAEGRIAEQMRSAGR